MSGGARREAAAHAGRSGDPTLSTGLIGAVGITGALLLLAGGSAAQPPGATPATTMSTTSDASHPYVGMWVTADGAIRHQLLPNGRYDEARGTRESAYRGRYMVDGNTIDYVDDTGFTADGIFVSENELHHAGMVLFRQTP